MEPFQQRVVDEKKELDEKRGKLAAFMDSPTHNNLDEVERARLHGQLEVMTEYSDILADRIAAFVKPDQPA